MNDLKTDPTDAEEVSAQNATGVSGQNGTGQKSSQSSRRQRSTLTPEVADQICERLTMGESLRQICQDPNMPARSSIFLWLRRNKEFADQYRLAKLMLAEDLLLEILEIADDSSNDWVERRDNDGQIRRVVNLDNIRRAKLRISARKLHLARLMPKRYRF